MSGLVSSSWLMPTARLRPRLFMMKGMLRQGVGDEWGPAGGLWQQKQAALRGAGCYYSGTVQVATATISVMASPLIDVVATCMAINKGSQEHAHTQTLLSLQQCHSLSALAGARRAVEPHNLTRAHQPLQVHRRQMLPM